VLAPCNMLSYSDGRSIFALCHLTLELQAGATDEEVTKDHVGSPERLEQGQIRIINWHQQTDLTETTSHPLDTAALQMRLPRNQSALGGVHQETMLT
jgi:hypothetical protein